MKSHVYFLYLKLIIWTSFDRVGVNVKKIFKDETLYQDRESQITAINKTFEEAKAPVIHFISISFQNAIFHFNFVFISCEIDFIVCLRKLYLITNTHW